MEMEMMKCDRDTVAFHHARHFIGRITSDPELMMVIAG